MIEILARQRGEIAARIVRDYGLGIQIYAAARLHQPLVEFRVFVVREGFVIAAERKEDLAIEGRMMAVVDQPGSTGHAV